MNDERVLVTGGAGFIGSHLVAALIGRGHTVRVADSLATGYRHNLAAVEGRYEWCQGDLADLEFARSVVEGVDVIFHQAAIPSVPRSVKDPIETHLSGPTATLNILESARKAGVRRVMFAASSSAYGETEELPKHEGIVPQPLSPYAASKLAGEHYIHVYAQTMGVDGVSLRYFNVFGPRQDPSSPYSGVIAKFIDVMSSGDRPTIFGDGQQTRDFTYVDNVVHANLLAMDAPGRLGGVAVNVGTGKRISLLDLVDGLNELLRTKLEPRFEPARAGDVKDSLADLTQAQRILRYEPVTDFRAGLAATLDAAGKART